MISASTPDQYVVMGNPISHSKSPYLHTKFAEQCQQAMQYNSLLVDLNGFASAVQQLVGRGVKGANVTLPFKLDAFQLCTTLSARAQAAGAVNCLTFSGPYILGDNTDGDGLVIDITRNAGVSLTGKRLLICGAGGAARGALLPILECQPSEIVIANRTVAKAEQLAEQFSRYGNLQCAQFEHLSGQFDVVINATSASIAAQRPPVPESIYSADTLAYDLMYADQPTLFMQHAAQQQACTRDGWGMLVEQAAQAFYSWRGIRPDTSGFLKK